MTIKLILKILCTILGTLNLILAAVNKGKERNVDALWYLGMSIVDMIIVYNT